MGNQVRSIADSVPDVAGSGDYYDGTNGYSAQEYFYDMNGNTVKNDNKEMSTLNNYLNLPSRIYETNTPTSKIEYVYTSAGEKLKQRLSTGTTLLYFGNFVYTLDCSANGIAVKYILTQEGRATNSAGAYTYEYFMKDHLGNTRVSFNVPSSTALIVQQSDYYPFGMIHQPQATTTSDNRYLYNGKEFQNNLLGSVNLDLYDYGVRFYDPHIGRWTTVDPLADKYYFLSPFSYVANNPLKFIDPDGKEIVIVTKRNSEGSIVEKLKYSERKLYMNNGKEYSGSNFFALKVQNTLNNLVGTNNKDVQGTVSSLEGSKNKHYIEYNPSGANDVVPTAIDLDGVNKGDPSGSHVRVSLIEGEIENGLPSTKETIMAHELKHADDYDKGNMVGRKGVEPSNTSPFEIRAVNFENKVRSANKMELRKTYGGKPIDKKKLEDPTK